RAFMLKVPRFAHSSGFACTTTWAPSLTGADMAPRTRLGIVTFRDISTDTSLNVMNAREEALFALSWMTWPSTQMGDIFEMYSAILWLRRRTGHGVVAVVSAAVAGRGAVVMVLVCLNRQESELGCG